MEKVCKEVERLTSALETNEYSVVRIKLDPDKHMTQSDVLKLKRLWRLVPEKHRVAIVFDDVYKAK